MNDAHDEARGELPAGHPFRPAFEITPAETRRRMADETAGFLLIDCREDEEVAAASVAGAVHVPMAVLIDRPDDLDAVELGPETHVGIICHHGNRSAQAALLLRERGYANVWSVAGGIEVWSLLVDETVPRYTRAGRSVQRL